MATIERKPLPPPNSRAARITEADRAEILAKANDVIDYYLNGAGSYFESGTRKPLAGEYEGNSVNDLRNFKSSVIASKQFADDPSSIMDSVLKLIDQAIEQIEKTARDNEGRDSISIVPPDTNDPIDDPRVISPLELNNGALRLSLPESAGQRARPFQSSSTSAIPSSRPERYLARRIAGRPDASAVGASVEVAPPLAPSHEVLPLVHQSRLEDRSETRFSLPEAGALREPYQPGSPHTGRPLGIFSGKPMSEFLSPLPIWEAPDTSARRSAEDDWLLQLLAPRRGG